MIELVKGNKEKSILLARAAQWFLFTKEHETNIGDDVYLNLGKLGEYCTGALWRGGPLILEFYMPDLYAQQNMSLALLIHWWAIFEMNSLQSLMYFDWWTENGIWTKDDAQRLWLDKILQLATDAGLVKQEG